MVQNKFLVPRPQSQDIFKFLLVGFKLLFGIKCGTLRKMRARVLGLSLIPKLPKTSFWVPDDKGKVLFNI